MNIEQRLIEVFQTSAMIEPTPDLFARVVHSIEEDRQHRQRIVRSVSVLLAAALAVVGVGALAVESGRFGRFVHRPTMEALEAVVMIALLLVLGPAIRRFGRGYAQDLWPSSTTMPRSLLRLLDVAYFLVGIGYILVTTEFKFSDGLLDGRLAGQLEAAGLRFGGLLLLLGVLHAATLFMLPIVALIDNSTRRSKPVPRWVIILMAAVVLNFAPVIPMAIAIGLSG